MPTSTSATTALAIQHHTAALQVEFANHIQSVWSGYGAIDRYRLRFADRIEHIVLKTINKTPSDSHPRGWNNAFAHQRKQSSYQNELNFYQHYSGKLNEQAQVAGFLGRFEDDTAQYLLLTDLNHQGFKPYLNNEGQMLSHGVQWLAHFHAFWIDQATDTLWPQGNYWHLATRPQEWQTMATSNLKASAKTIDERLQAAQYKTLIHGDAKLANFLFNNQRAAAVDFQYVGRGIGSADLMYFLGSMLDEEGLEQYYEHYVSHYFKVLEEALILKGFARYHELMEEWKVLLPMAWADFQRFIAGWNPGHKKDHRFSRKQTTQALAAINAN